MAKLTLKAIKKENAKKVLEVIARNKHITKLEISNETGLSLMTVGKIVSMLGAGGIILHSKNNSQKVGRRAEVLRVRHDWLIPVFEIASRIFKFYITDLEGNILEKIEYRCIDNPDYIANEFIGFLHKTVEVIKSKYKHKKALGVGVSVAGIYDTEKDQIMATMMPELSSIKLMRNISKIFNHKNVVIDNANRLCAIGLIEGELDYSQKTISCITINDAIETTTCDKGIYISGAQGLAGRLGDLPCSRGVTYASFLRNQQNTIDIFDEVLDLLKIICVSYDPDTIYLCSDKFTLSPGFSSRLSCSLKCGMSWHDNPPDLHVVNTSTIESISGIISRLIGNWLDDLIDN